MKLGKSAIKQQKTVICIRMRLIGRHFVQVQVVVHMVQKCVKSLCKQSFGDSVGDNKQTEMAHLKNNVKIQLTVKMRSKWRQKIRQCLCDRLWLVPVLGTVLLFLFFIIV